MKQRNFIKTLHFRTKLLPQRTTKFKKNCSYQIFLHHLHIPEPDIAFSQFPSPSK